VCERKGMLYPPTRNQSGIVRNLPGLLKSGPPSLGQAVASLTGATSGGFPIQYIKGRGPFHPFHT